MVPNPASDSYPVIPSNDGDQTPDSGRRKMYSEIHSTTHKGGNAIVKSAN